VRSKLGGIPLSDATHLHFASGPVELTAFRYRVFAFAPALTNLSNGARNRLANAHALTSIACGSFWAQDIAVLGSIAGSFHGVVPELLQAFLNSSLGDENGSKLFGFLSTTFPCSDFADFDFLWNPGTPTQAEYT
jgi:hypothetical protein